MKFLVDECTGTRVTQWLRESGFDVSCVYGQARGWTDDDLLAKANNEDWIIVTNDTDFGQKIYRDGCSHKGVILLRLKDERSRIKIEVLKRVLSQYHKQLKNTFIVCSEDKLRIT